jgi:hypothetical protein
MLARMSSWNLNMTRCRVVTGVFRQPGKAVLAASTAALNSSAVVSGIRDTTSCVACDNPHTSTVDRSKFDQPEIKKKNIGREAGLTGLVTSTCSSARDSTNSPPMRRRTLDWGGGMREVKRDEVPSAARAIRQKQRTDWGTGRSRGHVPGRRQGRWRATLRRRRRRWISGPSPETGGARGLRACGRVGSVARSVRERNAPARRGAAGPRAYLSGRAPSGAWVDGRSIGGGGASGLGRGVAWRPRTSHRVGVVCWARG